MFVDLAYAQETPNVLEGIVFDPTLAVGLMAVLLPIFIWIFAYRKVRNALRHK